MFSPGTYRARRKTLLEADRPASGLVLLLGNEQSPMNYAGNPYPFRQDSTFLYYFGIAEPGLVGLVDLVEGTSRLYGHDPELNDVIWMGERPSLKDHGEAAGVSETFPPSALETHLTDVLRKNRPVHFLPPYRPNHRHRLGTLLGLQHDRVDTYASVPLVRTVVQQRLRKTKSEVQQLDTAVDVSATMHEAAMQLAEPGRTEREIAGRLAGISEAQGRGLSFRPTCSIHGEVLHNHNYSNELSAGDLLLVDAGSTSPEQYAGDITRVTPVGGSFSPRQRAVYQGVLAAQRAAIDAIAPDVPFRDIHLLAARILTEHLIEMGLMKGDADAAVAAGAHALFFPHGLGHMLGLDVHDMENLGEDIVGYASDQTRSDQFGLHTLRLARPLEPGYVVTVEPGCYFIPELIRQWRSDDRHAEFIDYEAVESFADFGGIRIEDDVLVTKEGAEILGPGIPKTIDDVESRTSTAPPSS